MPKLKSIMFQILVTFKRVNFDSVIKYKNIKELSYTSHVKMKPSENTLGIGTNKQSIIKPI